MKEDKSIEELREEREVLKEKVVKSQKALTEINQLIYEAEKPKFNEPKESYQVQKEMEVYRLLKSFSMANGGKGNWEIIKMHGKFLVQGSSCSFFRLNISFKTFEVAQEALRRYRKELEELR